MLYNIIKTTILLVCFLSTYNAIPKDQAPIINKTSINHTDSFSFKKIQEIEKQINTQNTSFNHKDKINDLKLKAIINEIDSINSSNNIILTIASLLFGVVAVLIISGATISHFERKLIKKEMRASIKTNGKDFKKMLSKLVNDKDIFIKDMTKTLDQFKRITRLMLLLESKNYEPQPFYSDLSQLAQNPTPSMIDLALAIQSQINQFPSKDRVELNDFIDIILAQ